MTQGYQAFDGFSWRPLTGEEVPAVYELEAAGEAFDDGTIEVRLSDLEGDWSRPDFNPATMSIGVFAGPRLVGYALVFQGRAEALVHPEYRGKGIGSRLARWTWIAAGSEGRDRVGQTISDNETAAIALFATLGYQRGHTAWILRRPITPQEPEPVLPAGYGFRAYHSGTDDRTLYELIDGAFAEWRNADSEPMGFENWAASTLGSVIPDSVVLIEWQGRLVGVAVGQDYEEAREGWIHQIAVRREHRGQGLGRALLEESFRRFGILGRERCGISTDSRTGALGLYERVGMKTIRSYTRWVKIL